jgi:hypothetical protein
VGSKTAPGFSEVVLVGPAVELIRVNEVDRSDGRSGWTVGGLMRKPFPMQEFRTALAVALGLAVTCFGAVVLAASLIVK